MSVPFTRKLRDQHRPPVPIRIRDLTFSVLSTTWSGGGDEPGRSAWLKPRPVTGAPGEAREVPCR